MSQVKNQQFKITTASAAAAKCLLHLQTTVTAACVNLAIGLM